MTTARLRPLTRRQYWTYFVRFAKAVDLERYSPKQLTGDKGRELLISFYPGIPPYSRAYAMAAIRKVWRKGMGIPWPLEPDDLEAPPTPRIVRAPKREIVERWVRAAEAEPDLYERSWFFVELTFGYRPTDQQAALRRKHIVRNTAGQIVGLLVEDPRSEGFKRDSIIESAVPPIVAKALDAWLQEHPDGREDAFIWPWRSSVDGHLVTGRPMTDDAIRRTRQRFAKRWHLPWLTSKDMRHFVRTVLNECGMPTAERHLWQGHKPKGGDMDVQYGSRQPEETFAVQMRHLPDGPLGTFLKVERTTGDVPSELLELWSKLKAREIDAMDVANALKALVKRETTVTVDLVP